MSTSGVSSSTNSGLLAEQLIDTSGGLTSSSTLTNSGAGGTLQLTGLASGINTTELIQAELAEQEQPLENLEEEVSSLNTQNSSLNSLQDALQTVSDDALVLGEPSTFFPVQNISSSDSNLITAATSDGVGAVIGSTSITVTALATAAQTAFSYTAGTGTGDNTLSITVGSGTAQTIQVADDASAEDIAEAINGAGNLGAWATVNSAGQLVLSSQQTGSGNLVSATLTDATSGSDTATLVQPSAFNYIEGSGAGDNTLSITVGDGAPQTIQVADDASAASVAAAINGTSGIGVTATVDSSGQLVLTSQQGGAVSAALTDASGSTATWTDSSTAQDGTDAVYYLDGSSTASTSPTDSVTNAIPGVTLTLNGITGETPTDNPVTITTDAPGPNTTVIIQAVNQFASDYNNVLSAINSDVNTAPASESTPSDYSPYSGSLFGDDQLEELMSDMRTAMYQDYSGSGIIGSSDMTSLDEIGISSAGQATGTVTSTSESGQLTVNTQQLTSALESNPSGVQALIQSWSANLQSIVNAAASPSGSLEGRIQGNDTLVTSLSSQLTSQEALFNTEEQNMEQEWAQVESTLEDLDNQKTSLSSFATSLSSTSSS